jgi:DNA-binding LacI/PurR family transcriptional regulator
MHHFCNEKFRAKCVRYLESSASYVSKALNNHPSISEKVKESVKKKAIELNYKHNSHMPPISDSKFNIYLHS